MIRPHHTTGWWTGHNNETSTLSGSHSDPFFLHCQERAHECSFIHKMNLTVIASLSGFPWEPQNFFVGYDHGSRGADYKKVGVEVEASTLRSKAIKHCARNHSWVSHITCQPSNTLTNVRWAPGKCQPLLQQLGRQQ